ncbi:tetraacyldisaccharide 4'-kinase [Oceanisphaera avium]|uniref:Tetraacyldisaccharide 4'-kinase n=1 Tax=Oceanisphaera avium TaxID=1903694 RepID=A0A1Y0CVI4_9GAMM|nr:tetraacyldisaccharide 4'-kinase [Oceanisphaera avium]ART79024.1 tetraacyldisaccharide 4'-kinase [Oceanisphaera avium]
MTAWYKGAWWLWLLAPFSALFWLLSALRRMLYRLGIKSSYRAPVPVIVVGNLSVGGNGKTPVVVWLVQWLRAQGYQPGVISRGYGGKSAHYPLKVEATTCPSVAGDEPVLIAKRTGCPLVVGPKRGEAAALLARLGADIIISDDGLQHYALARDIELVVVDGERRFGNGYLLPMGPLRERPWRLKQVDAIINNGGPAHDQEYLMTLAPGDLIAVGRTAGFAPHPPQTVHALAGIGHPPRFFSMLQQLGFKLAKCIALSDHEPVAPHLLQSLATLPLLVTEKDAVKWPPEAKNTWYVPVDAHLPQTFEALLLSRLKELHRGD